MDRYQRHDADLVDSALLLTLWQRCAIDHGCLGSRTRLMKLAFLAARQCAESGAFALSFEFHQWKRGPSSPAVLEAWRRLEHSGHIREEEIWELTDRGKRLADDFYRDVVCKEEYGPVRTVFDELAAAWAAVDDDRALCATINRLPSAANGAGTIAEAAELSTLVAPPASGLPLINLETESAWVETLAIEFSANDRAGIQRAAEDFRAGRYRVA